MEVGNAPGYEETGGGRYLYVEFDSWAVDRAQREN